MSLGPYIKVNPNERPTEYLRRVRAVGSDGSVTITHKEIQEGTRLLQAWEMEKYKRLTALPTSQLARETRAIKEMQKLAGSSTHRTPFAMASAGGPWDIGDTLVVLVIGAAIIAMLGFLGSAFDDKK